MPSGGRLDGVLGVVAAVHAVALLKQEGFEPQRPLWVVAFMDEEGTRFDAALFGLTPRDAAGALDRIGTQHPFPELDHRLRRVGQDVVKHNLELLAVGLHELYLATREHRYLVESRRLALTSP